MSRCPVPPTCFVPSCPADFVGQAGKVAEMSPRKIDVLREDPERSLKLLISGKTTRLLISHRSN